jgi:hypothetical protein
MLLRIAIPRGRASNVRPLFTDRLESILELEPNRLNGFGRRPQLRGAAPNHENHTESKRPGGPCYRIETQQQNGEWTYTVIAPKGEPLYTHKDVGSAQAEVATLTALELNPTARLGESHELPGMRLSRRRA